MSRACRASAIARRLVGRDQRADGGAATGRTLQREPDDAAGTQGEMRGAARGEHRVEQRRARRAEGGGVERQYGSAIGRRVAAQRRGCVGSVGCGVGSRPTRRGRRCTHRALALQDAAGRDEAAVRIEAQPCGGRDQADGAIARGREHGLQQLAADAAALAVGPHDDEAYRCAVATVVPPQRRAHQRTVDLAGAEAAAEREVQWPVVNAVRPVLRLGQRQRHRQVGGG